MNIHYFFKLLVIAFLPLLFPLTGFAEEQTDSYICVTEESTGFHAVNGVWGIHSLPLEEKFILRKFKPEDEQFKIHEGAYSHGLFDHGSEISSMECTFKGFFSCKGMGEFFFDPKVGRFIKTRTWGYWAGDDKTVSYPHISRGKCSKI